jgi:hypothetical protein
MQHPKAHRRGWVAEAPRDAHTAFAARVDSASGKSAETLQFQRQADGSWSISLSASESTQSFADVTLDISQECLRVAFPGQPQQDISWPPGTSAAQMDACSARFSKRRRELLITIPATQDDENYSGSVPSSRGEELCTSSVPAPHEEPSAPTLSRPCLTAPPDQQQEQSLPQRDKVALAGKVEDRATVKAPVKAHKDFGFENPGAKAMCEGGANVLWEGLKKAALDVQRGGREPLEEPDGVGEKIDPVALTMAGTWMLHSAAATGDAKRLQALLSAGIDANAPDESGVGALEKAVLGCHTIAVNVLLNRGAKPSGIATSTSTPLHRAVAAGAEGRGLVQLLVARGASRTAKDASGRTPIDLAREFGMEPLPELR